MQCNGWMTCMKEQHGMNLCDSHMRKQETKWNEWQKLQWTELQA